MSDNRWQRIENIFHQAVELAPEARSAFLHEACATDESLRKEVESLLAHETEDGSTFVNALGALEDTVTTLEDLSGRTIGPYRVLRRIGSGGMGVVYEACDTRLDRHVALKVLPASMLTDETARARLVREARMASKLNHPHVCTVHEVGESDGQAYIAMELVEGRTLSARLAEGALPTDEVLRFGQQVADALAHAHDHGVVHRDLKSANVMITPDGRAKVLDFGLAKRLSAESPGEAATQSRGSLTAPGVVVGTLAYMAPEQLRGQPADARSDIWALGVVLYEMAAGGRPFQGTTGFDLSSAILNQAPPPLPAAVSSELGAVIERCLRKEPTARYQTARELLADLRALQPGLAPPPRMPARRTAVVLSIIGLAALLGGGIWLFRYYSHIRWATQTALPQITQLVQEGKFTAAFDLAKEVEKFIPTDSRLTALWPDIARSIRLETDPPGAEMYRKDYNEPETAWRLVGKSPAQLTVPRGYVSWKFVKQGFETTMALGWAGAERETHLLAPKQQVPEGMVHIPEYPLVQGMAIGGVGDLMVSGLPAFWMDRYEVSNRQFKEFVDRGGYRNKDYWRHTFRRGSRMLSWEQAIRSFVDATGRPGPATWEAGTYPVGEDDFPVCGVSWYEAAAYAEFAGKQLPTISHWYRASEPRTAAFVVPLSNFKGAGPARVGQFQGIGPFGTYDMAGNVKEWCFNETNDGYRFILGGGFHDPTYGFTEPEAKPPLDRDAQNGFRCVRYTVQPRQALLNPKLRTEFALPTPASDEVFRSYRALFSYEPKELHARTIDVDPSNPEWTEERVTFEAAYSAEQVPGCLFIPRKATPPFQVVVFHPSTVAVLATSDQTLDRTPSWDYLVRAGRAVFHPVFANTYGRKKPFPRTPVGNLARLVERGQDIRRAVDYLETRKDIDRTRIGYMGLSWGANSGPIFLAVEPRFKAAVLQGGGFSRTPALPELNAVNYAPRVRIPVLMINGRYDSIYPVEASQKPMFNLLGTPPADKRHALLETPHDTSLLRHTMMRETLDWLDKYLGPVQR